MKEFEPGGNSAVIVLRLLAPIVMVAALAARADACPPAVALTGDAGLVASVGDLLAAHGIAGATPACPAVHARLARDGGAVVVGIERTGEQPVERRVSEVATAATVIESWTRTDDETSLLAPHAVAAEEHETIAAPVATSTPTVRGVQLFANAVAARASDDTDWGGIQLGMCINLGALCAATRVRFSRVLHAPDAWGTGVHRESVELMVGLDVPIQLGRFVLTPGFAAGMGKMHTGSDDMSQGETAGLRADMHATLTIPLTRRWSLDVSLTGDLTQKVHVESKMPLPDEPRGLLWGGIGVRYGGL